jgi:bacterioferritin
VPRFAPPQASRAASASVAGSVRDERGRLLDLGFHGDAYLIQLMDRILLLDGHPNLQRLGTVMVGESVLEQLQLDKTLEENAIAMYRRGVALTHELGDPGTRELLEHFVVSEEEHLDWIDTQLSVIDDIGIERYLQSHLHS